MQRNLAMLLPLVVFTGCGADPEGGTIPGGSASDRRLPASRRSPTRAAFSCRMTHFSRTSPIRSATPDDALTMGSATSVWFKTSDDFSQVAEFYKGKFPDGAKSR